MAKTYRLIADSVQHRFQQSRAPIQIFGGAFANGKSSALIVKALTLASVYPGSLGLLGRATYPKLNDTLRRDFINDWCPKSFVKKYPTQEDNAIYFNNGSVIQFRYVSQRGKTREDGSTTSNLLSATYDYAVIDQIEDPEITHKDFLDILGRLRRQTPYRPPEGQEDSTMPSTGPNWFLIGANPAQNWFYKEVVHPYTLWRDKKIKSEKLIVDVDTGEPIIEMFEGSTYTNKHNLPARYIKTLEAAYKGQMRDRYLLGKWAAFEGLVHAEFSPERHVITKREMLDYLRSCRATHVKVRALEGYDFGQVVPSCYILGFVDDHGRVFLLDGFYKSNFNFMDQPEEIFEIRRRYAEFFHVKNRGPEPILADPAVFKSRVISKRRTGTTLAEELTGLGLNLRPADNSIVSGIAKVNAYLAGKDGVPHIMTGEDPGPLLYICDELTWVLDEIGSYYWKRNPQMAFMDEPQDHDDHAMNVIKYMLSKRPEPSKIVLPKDMLPPKWKFWNEMSTEDYQRRLQGA